MSKKKHIQEDMLAPMGSMSPAGSEGPGQTHQTPGGMSTDMDTFSLLGPGKTKDDKDGKRTKKKEENTFPSNKVYSFGEFIKNRSTK